MTDTVLITGATGSIGSQLTRQLAGEDGIAVRVFVRDEDKAAPLRDLGAELAIGDFGDRATLDDAVAGVDTLVLIAPPGPAATQQNSNVIAAAKDAGVSKIVRVSAIKAAPDGPTENTRLHAASDEELQASGLAYVILRPNYFMQNLFMSLQTINDDSAFHAGAGDGRVAMVDVRDVVDCAARAVVSDDFDNDVLELSGPASVTFHDVAAAIGKVAGRPVNYVPISPEDVRQSMLGLGMDDWTSTLLRDYAQAFSEGWGDLVTDGVERMTGHPPRSIGEFVEEVLAPAIR